MSRIPAGLAGAAMALAVYGCHDRPALTESIAGSPPAASVAATDPAGRYLVVFALEQIPPGLDDMVRSLRGSVETAVDAIGVAVVTGLDVGAADQLARWSPVRYVEPEGTVSASDRPDEVALAEASSDDADPVSPMSAGSPAGAQLYARQWNLRAIAAERAWAAGHLGSRDVVVGILDTGIDYLNPELIGMVDLERSASFVDDAWLRANHPGRHPVADPHGHGTAVAAMIASNAVRLAGVNRHVTFLAVKIRTHLGADPTFAGRALEGIVYAADQGADVINMSFFFFREHSANPGLIAAFQRAANYANRKGAVLVAVPGGGGMDLDEGSDRVLIPCQLVHVLCVAGTGPTGAAGVNGPWENVDASWPETNFGRSAVDVAAPSGAGPAGSFRRLWAPCTTTPSAVSLAPCIAGQPVVLVAGNSYAVAHTSGLAALLVAHLGSGKPAAVGTRIMQSADDLGEPGRDPRYGHGRINVARALGVAP